MPTTIDGGGQIARTDLRSFVSAAAPFRRQVARALRGWLSSLEPTDMREILSEALVPGRRVRSSIVLMLMSDGCPDHCQATLGSKSLDAALAVELLHRASLLVDDLVDMDLERRGVPTFHVAHGGHVAVVAGHLLAAEALKLIPDSHPELMRSGIETYRSMAIGELFDVHATPSPDSALRLYESRVLRKTSAPFRFACELAAALGPGAISPAEARRIGEFVGRYYQMANDWYDWCVADLTERGRKNCYRITLSLPLAVAVDSGAIGFGAARVGQLVSADDYGALQNSIRCDQVVRLVGEHLRKARQQAIRELDGAPVSWRRIMTELCDWAGESTCWRQSERVNAGY